MTREELKVHCEKQIEMCEMWASAKGEEPSGKVYEEHKLILELLEQEPCDNVVSRQAVLDALDKRFDSVPMEQTKEILLLRKDLRELPLVNPQPKTGHWIRQSDDYHDYYECEHCGIAVGLDDIKNYCPKCGAKMVEPQESEVRDED